jgi:hemolysin activation/secretion protein
MRRKHMNSCPRSVLLVLVCLFCCLPATIAGVISEDRRAELQKVLERLRQKKENEAASVGQALPDDQSLTFDVRQLQIGGNALISTARLLDKLPLVYAVTTVVDGNDVTEKYDFRPLYDTILEPGQTRKVSLNTVQGFTKYLLSVYRKEGYIGIYVYVPIDTLDQSNRLLDQILKVEVLEGKAATIDIKSYDFDRQERKKGFLKASLIESWSPVKVGDAIKKKQVDDFVGLLNLNPDRYVSPTVSRSTDPEALTLGYDVYEGNPWHWYIQVDNSGSKDRQWAPRVGVVNTNLTGSDDTFGVMYQAPWEKGMEEDYSVFGSYDFPVLTPRLRLNLYAGYSQFDVTPAAGPPVSFLGNGSFTGGVLSYNVFQLGGWFADVIGSVSHERSKVTPSLGVKSDVDIDLWGVGVKLHRPDKARGSTTSFVFNRVESMGGSGRDEFQLARLDSDPDFAVYSFAASHTQFLDPNTKVNRISASLRMINPTERLVPAKMTAFGGLYSVRGYEEDEVVADGGVLISAQYEFDLVKHAQAARPKPSDTEEEGNKKRPWLKKLAPLAFIDYARAKTKSPVADERSVRELCSVGIGTILELEDDFSGALYCGWPLRGTEETDRGDFRLNVSLIKRF